MSNNQPDEVMTRAQWRRKVNISESTHRRLKKAGKAPDEIQLSDRRRGITSSAHERWLRERAITDV